MSRRLHRPTAFRACWSSVKWCKFEKRWREPPRTRGRITTKNTRLIRLRHLVVAARGNPMAVVDNPMTFGRPRLDFASEHDIDEFVDMLGKYERAEITPEEWRRFRLVRGTYGQRQDNVQMLRIKIPQGIVTSSQMRALAGVAARHSRGFCHVTTRQNIQYHFVQLSVVERVMRDLAAEGLTTREACGNSVRNITGCQYAGTSDSEIFDPTPYAEAMTRYFLRHPLSGVLPRKFKIAFEGCREDHAFASINDIGWRARIQDGRRGFRVTVAGGTSILP